MIPLFKFFNVVIAGGLIFVIIKLAFCAVNSLNRLEKISEDVEKIRKNIDE